MENKLMMKPSNENLVRVDKGNTRELTAKTWKWFQGNVNELNIPNERPGLLKTQVRNLYNGLLIWDTLRSEDWIWKYKKGKGFFNYPNRWTDVKTRYISDKMGLFIVMQISIYKEIRGLNI